jgi:hypothetical protein
MTVDKIDRLYLVVVVLHRSSIARHIRSGRMSTNTRLTISSCLSLLFVTSAFSQTDYSQYMNPLIGSEGPIPGLEFGGG